MSFSFRLSGCPSAHNEGAIPQKEGVGQTARTQRGQAALLRLRCARPGGTRCRTHGAHARGVPRAAQGDKRMPRDSRGRPSSRWCNPDADWARRQTRLRRNTGVAERSHEVHGVHVACTTVRSKCSALVRAAAERPKQATYPLATARPGSCRYEDERGANTRSRAAPPRFELHRPVHRLPQSKATRLRL